MKNNEKHFPLYRYLKRDIYNYGKKKKVSILFQIAILFIFGVVLIGALFMMASKILLEHNVKVGKSPALLCSSIRMACQKRSILMSRCSERSASWSN